MSRNAFILAQVLITLGIIGVVAAMTMPTLITKYQKKQTVTQLKKAYSELTQAFTMAQKDLGMIEDWDFSSLESQSQKTKYFFDNVLAPNLKIARSCIPSSTDCWSNKTYTLKETAYTSISVGADKTIAFVTNSGYNIFFWVHATGDGGRMFIDVNGKKKPNMLGKDVFSFQFWIASDCSMLKYCGLYPSGLYSNQDNVRITNSRTTLIAGADTDANGNSVSGCSSTSNRYPGLTCAALIMADGWEIKDDYPW